MYAVIDLETTGLRPGWHDRICEIAVVRLDAGGRVRDEWCSLVNPGRDLGPQQIHGITAAQARQAPSFADLAGHLAGLLRGQVIVAHNLAFDLPFLAAEYQRTGAAIPGDHQQGLCTMRLAGDFLPTASRSLHACCLAAGITLRYAHSALHDARAAASLLGYYLAAAGQPPPWQPLVAAAGTLPWPALPVTGAAAVPRGAPPAEPEQFLARLVDRLPRVPDPPQADAYLALLDQILLDRHISVTEADALVTATTSLGLTRGQVLRLHQDYLHALAAEAVDDGVVTGPERQDLRQVAGLLGLTGSDVDAAVDRARHRLPGTVGGGSRPAVPRFRLRAGDTVVFTGQMAEPREAWEARARAAGLCVGRSVTRKTRLLVAADPDTMSGKGRQAQAYRVPIVLPAAFGRMLAELVGQPA